MRGGWNHGASARRQRFGGTRNAKRHTFKARGAAMNRNVLTVEIFHGYGMEIFHGYKNLKRWFVVEIFHGCKGIYCMEIFHGFKNYHAMLWILAARVTSVILWGLYK